MDTYFIVVIYDINTDSFKFSSEHDNMMDACEAAKLVCGYVRTIKTDPIYR